MNFIHSICPTWLGWRHEVHKNSSNIQLNKIIDRVKEPFELVTHDISVFSRQLFPRQCITARQRAQYIRRFIRNAIRQNNALLSEDKPPLKPKKKKPVYVNTPVTPAQRKYMKYRLRYPPNIHDDGLFSVFISAPNSKCVISQLSNNSTVSDLKQQISDKWSVRFLQLGYNKDGQIQLVCDPIDWNDCFLLHHGKPLRV